MYKLLESTIQNSSQSQDEKIVNCTTNSTKNEDSNICKSEFIKSKVETNIKPVETQIQLDAANQKKSNSLFLRPLPKIVDQLLKFLSEDLINKTLNVFIYKYFNCSNKLIYTKIVYLILLFFYINKIVSFFV